MTHRKPFVALLADARGTEAPDLLIPYAILAECGAVEVKIVAATAELIRLTAGVAWVAPHLTLDNRSGEHQPEIIFGNHGARPFPLSVTALAPWRDSHNPCFIRSHIGRPNSSILDSRRSTAWAIATGAANSGHGTLIPHGPVSCMNHWPSGSFISR
jgi:hypothetical protein